MEKNISRRNFLKKGGLAALTMIPLVSCATRGQPIEVINPHKIRPDVLGGENYAISSNTEICEIDENVAPYHVHPVGIFGVPYYHAVTPIGNAFFKKELSAKDVSLTMEEGQIKGFARRVSGEKGLYFLEPARDDYGKKIDVINLNPEYKKAVKKGEGHESVKKIDGLEIFCEIEKDYPFNFGVIELENLFREKELYLAIKAKEHKEELYDFYLAPVEGSSIRTFEKDGSIQIINIDNFLRPTLMPWEEMNEKIEKLSSEKEKIQAKEALKEMGCPLELEVLDINRK